MDSNGPPNTRGPSLRALIEGVTVGMGLFALAVGFAALVLAGATGHSVREALSVALGSPHLFWVAVVSATGAWLAARNRLESFVRERMDPGFASLLDKFTRDLPGMVYQFRFRPTGHGSVTHASAGIRTIYELEPEDARRDGNQILDLVHPEDRERIVLSLRRSHTHLTAWHEEFRVILPHAGERWRLGHARVERLPDGGSLWHGVVVDITETKRATRELEHARREAEASNRAKSRLLAMLSHDIRTPIHGILGFAHLLKDSGLRGENAENLRAIEQSGESLLELVNDILDLARMEAGQLSVQPRPFDLRTAVLEVVRSARARAEARGLRVECEIAPETPRGIVTDRVRLLQVLNNLIGNAVKFTEFGEVVLQVDHRAGPTDEWSFSVTDTGPGIPESERERIFGEYQQVEDSAARDGAGLGLAITRQICRRLGGDVTVASQPGKGSTFRATIVAPATEALPTDQLADLRQAARGRRVLLVEDNVINARLMNLLLARMGASVETATNAPAALIACRHEPFDLVLMDVDLPGMNGLEATRELRLLEGMGEIASEGRLRVVALTARTEDEDRHACFDSGMDDYLAKPIREEDLLRVLAAAHPTAPIT